MHDVILAFDFFKYSGVFVYFFVDALSRTIPVSSKFVVKGDKSLGLLGSPVESWGVWVGFPSDVQQV